MRTKVAIGLLFLVGQFRCTDDSSFDLTGTWVDAGSPVLQLMEVYSGNHGKLVYFSNDVERTQEFTYRLFDDRIAIDFIGDDAGETVHDLIVEDNDQIRISGLTDIPEDPSTTFRRCNIVRKNESNEIVLGVNDIYIDLENGIRLQSRCTGDSRCPTGAHCIWAGYARAEFYLVEGGDDHSFELSTIKGATMALRTDTLISGTRYTLLDITPYPDMNITHKPDDCKVKISIDESD